MGKLTNRKLHCIGDSHTSFFTGYNYIFPEYPAVGRGFVSNIFTYRLGAPLAYNLCELNTNSRSNEKLFAILASLNTEKDSVMLCFGEIDCRAHLLKQAEKRKCSIEITVKECIQRYLKVILQVQALGFNVFVWNAIPSAIDVNDPNSEYPYFGNYLERNKATQLFNSYLKSLSVLHNFQFVEIFQKLVDKEMCTLEQFYTDKIHLSTKLLPLTLNLIQKQDPDFHFESSQILLMRMNYLVWNFKRLAQIVKGRYSVKKEFRKLLGRCVRTIKLIR